jgi:hypothetical protein
MKVSGKSAIHVPFIKMEILFKFMYILVENATGLVL